MPSLSLISGLTAVLLLSPHFAVANPLPQPERSLEARFATNYVDCDSEQKARLGRAFADAANLGLHAYSIDTNSKAWSHYFRTEGEGKEEDHKNAKRVWSMVAANNDPTNPPYSFSVRCAKADHQDCKGGKSIAITDAQPQDGDNLREMLICPLFFNTNSKETQNDLNKRKFEKPQRGKDNSWCAPGNKFSWYEVAGHTLLHEMTHLDALGKAAGLEERQVNNDKGEPWFKTHGSEDVGGLGTSYPLAARKLAEIWQKGQNGDGTLKPYQNAENLAAAALEWYMMKFCKDSNNEIGEIEL